MATELTIHKGARVDIPLEFETSEGVAVVLTGLGPFVAQILDPGSTVPLLTFTVVESDLANGTVNLTATTGDTDNLPLRDSEWGMVDSTGYVWIPSSLVSIVPKPVYP